MGDAGARPLERGARSPEPMRSGTLATPRLMAKMAELRERRLERTGR